MLAYGDIFRGPGSQEFCRHGGGIALSTHGLWLAGAGRLWLLDPALLGTGDEVLRIWVVDDSIRASTCSSRVPPRWTPRPDVSDPERVVLR